MPRSKTYLSPSKQWQHTVRYLYFVHRTKWMEWQNWLSCYEPRQSFREQ